MRAKVKVGGPAPSERALFDVWNAIDQARVKGGEKAATQLARQALKAVSASPPKRRKDNG